MNKKLVSILLILSVYFLSAGASYALFSKNVFIKKSPVTSSQPASSTKGQISFDDSLPKTESCPLNGAMYSKPQREWWESHRPLGVMIENHEEARPQSGLSSADVIYEAVAEGGITRFLSVFYCKDAGTVGPVRSARTYFLDFISEYGNNPLYAHVGGANTPGPADALSQINEYDWFMYNDMNQISNGDLGFPIFLRDANRLGNGDIATEHTMYSKTSLLWDVAKKKRKLTNVDEEGNSWDKKFVEYSFKEDAATNDRPVSQALHVEFWGGYKQYFVDWDYDKVGNLYKRTNGGKPHLDLNTKKQLTTKNIVVLFMKQRSADDGYENNLHLLYGTKGTGRAMVFIDGRKMEATWKKEGRTARTLLFDTEGSSIKFDRGTIWFEILPADGVVNVR